MREKSIRWLVFGTWIKKRSAALFLQGKNIRRKCVLWKPNFLTILTPFVSLFLDKTGLFHVWILQSVNFFTALQGGNHKLPQSSSESQKGSSDQNSLAERVSGDKRRFPAEVRKADKGRLSDRIAALTSPKESNGPADGVLDDSVGRVRKDYKSLWRYYRMTANVSSSPYARPKQPISPYKNMAEVYASNGR